MDSFFLSCIVDNLSHMSIDKFAKHFFLLICYNLLVYS